MLSFELSGASAVSIDAAEDGRAYLLGDNGTVVSFDWQTPATSAELEASAKRVDNPAVEDLGPLRRLRVLRNAEIVCAGSVGQVYRRDASGCFMALPQASIGEDAVAQSENPAGESASDFTVATSDGFGARFDGGAWHKLDLPGSASLNAICRSTGKSYAIGGDNDTLLVGSGDRWRAVMLPKGERDYSGIAEADGALFLAHLGGIDVYDGTSLKAVEIPRRSRNEFAVLRSGPNGVWSFAGRSVGLIARGQWQVLA